MIPLPWKLIGSAAVAILLGVLFAVYRHSLIAEGENRIREINTKQAAALQQQADEITRAWAEKADEAEHQHDQELQDLRAYRLAHPLTGASELCKPAPSSQGHLPQATAGNRGHDGGSAAADIQPVPARDPRLASNRVQMLELLGARADQVSASRREWQQRERDEGTVERPTR